jgi:hypothetical protein
MTHSHLFKNNSDFSLEELGVAYIQAYMVWNSLSPDAYETCIKISSRSISVVFRGPPLSQDQILMEGDRDGPYNVGHF